MKLFKVVPEIQENNKPLYSGRENLTTKRMFIDWK